MRPIEKYISPLIEAQFPEFYQEEGQNFITFVQAYYEWMEQSGYAVNASRSLMDYKDVDTSIEQFANHFKHEFLQNFPRTTSSPLTTETILATPP